MSNTKKVLLIFGCVALVCLIGVGVVAGLYYARNGSGLGKLLSGGGVTLDEAQALDMTGAVEVVVECPAGMITVAPGGEARVELTGTIWTMERKDQYLKVTRDGDTIRVKLDVRPVGTNFVDVRMKVYLPEDSGVALAAASASGGIDVRDLALDGMTLSCASGGISVSGVTGGALTIESASGRVSVASSEFTGVNANCQSGRIEVRDTAGPVTLRCTSGRIEVENVAGALDISSTSGNVTVSQLQTPIEDIRIDVTSGGTTLRLSAQAAFTLDARTTSGGISCDFDRTVSGGDSDGPAGRRISGEVGGGGPSVVLNTVSGSIRILKG